MQQLQLYKQQKQLEEQNERLQHQRFALLAYECEQQLHDRNIRQSPTYISLINYINSYGYNPFDEQYMNPQSIVQLEHYLQIKFEQNLQESLQIDAILLEYFDKQLRCGTIAEEEDDEEPQEEQSSYGFDCMRGLKLQKELQLLKQQRKSTTKPKPYQDKDFPNFNQKRLSIQKVQQQQQPQEYEELVNDKESLYADIQNFERSLNNDFHQEEEYDIPQFGSYDSVTFKQQLQDQLLHYQNELKITKQSLEVPQLFQSPTKQDLLPKFELTSGNKDEQQLSPPKKYEKKKMPQLQQVSLLGSLFTPQVLKEMEYLNDDILPQQEYIVPVQYSEITVERAFIEERIKEKTIQQNERRRTHPTFSPFRVQIMDEIREALESKTDLRDCKTQLYVMQQLQSKMSEIFDFTVSLAKEIQSKGWLSKQSIIRINDQYKEFSHLLNKRQPNLQVKQDNNTIVLRMYQQLSEFCTAQFINQLCINQAEDSPYLLAIFTPLIYSIAMIDNDFPRVNSKIPQINLKLIQKIFSNASHVAQLIKSFPKLLLQRTILLKDIQLFNESIENLQNILSHQDAIVIPQNKELYLLIRQCYAIQQCFQLMENLKYENNPQLQLNDNKKYEEQWKQIGTRYASKKNKDEALQKQNQEMLEKFGIDFCAWQLNLQIQENELKKIKRLENQQLWKDRREEKLQQKLAIQKENQEILQENEEQFKLNQAVKEHDKQKRTQEFRERQQQKAFSSVMQKQRNLAQDSEVKKNQSQLIRQSSELLQSQKLELKNEKDSDQKYRHERINSARGHKKDRLTNSQKKEEEERVWQKAQELLAKQNELLNQKKIILQQLKNK